MDEIRPCGRDLVVHLCCASDVAIAAFGSWAEDVETKDIAQVVVEGLL